MPRPIREGLDYFYKGVHDWDSFAVMDLVNQYGPIGYCVYDIVLGRVYENGYYLEIPLDKLARYVVRTVGNRWLSDRNSAEEIIRFCAEIGLFDRELLERSVVTSVEIQTHYASVAARRKVDKRKYWLLKDVSGNATEEAAEKPHPTMKKSMTATETPVSAAITPVSAAITPVSASGMQQSRVNKSKANKSKADESKADESKADESKADESKADDSKADDSKANESEINKKRNGMKEAASAGFAAPAAAAAAAAAAAPTNAVEEAVAAVPYAAAAAAPENTVEEVFAAVPYAAAAAAALDNTVEEAFAFVTGRLCNTRDREALTIMRQAGADDEMIARLIRKVGRRTHKSIGSMNYFIPVVREALQKSRQPRFAGHSNARAGLCEETSNMEEVERLLDEEWEKETARYMLCSETEDAFTYE